METKIALLAYNFPHKKTQDFIFRLLVKGYKIDVIYAADAVKLNIPASSVKTKINHIGLVHPQIIAKQLNIDYKIIAHDSPELPNDIIKRGIDIGIISGARILKEPVINSFRLGIINYHPGIIPHARGLDALLWSIYNKQPLGVTAHLVDKRVDAGKILQINPIKIYKKDNIFDLSERLYEIQLEMLATSIEKTINKDFLILENYGAYNRKMPANLEEETMNQLPKYLEIFGE